MEWGANTWGQPVKVDAQSEEKPKRHRSSVYVTEHSDKYIYRRAFSEVSLLEAMGYEPLKEGYAYHFITGGNIDSVSFFKIILNQLKKIDYLLFSTWCMSSEDILQFDKWISTGKILKCDAYLGEIFKSSYSNEAKQLSELYAKYKCGRIAYFKNHSKIFAGWGGDFYFTIESSANINTNPRTEQAVITIDKGLTLFMKEYFDGIKSF